MKNRKRNNYCLIIVLFLSFLSCKNDSFNKNKYTMGEDAMEGQLRYGTFKYPKEFSEEIRYQFDISNKGKDIYYTVDINLLPIDDELKDLEKDIIEIKVHNNFFKEHYRKNMKIDKLDTFVIEYEYDTSSPRPEIPFLIENVCYIQIKKKELIKMKFKYYSDFFEQNKRDIEAFYKSCKQDLSNPYKTKFGSFIVPEGTFDFSHFRYDLKGLEENYFIEIEYNNPSDEEEPTIQSGLSEMLKVFKNLTYKLNTKKIKVGNKDATYNEIKLHNPAQNTTQKIAIIEVKDLNPPLKIQVTANDEQYFDAYKEKMEAVLQSFQFDQ